MVYRKVLWGYIIYILGIVLLFIIEVDVEILYFHVELFA